ncbi:MAG: monovalent cation/H(+) antiporter subunit G, partial [Trueperaceae bacterium]
MTDLIAALLLWAGAFFLLISGLGAVRFPDLFMRMHAGTKAGTLGAGLILTGAMVLFGEVAVTTKALLTFAFLLLTAPIAAHVLGRAAYYDGTPLWDRTKSDALRGKYDRGRRIDGDDAEGAPRPGHSRRRDGSHD